MKVERKPVEEHVYVITLTPEEAEQLDRALCATSWQQYHIAGDLCAEFRKRRGGV